MPYFFSIKNGQYNSSHSRAPVPEAVLLNNGRPSAELLASALVAGDGFYEVLMDGTLEPKLADLPEFTYTAREQKLQQAHAFLKTYARDFIIGNGTPTNAQRNNALDALIVVTVIEHLGE